MKRAVIVHGWGESPKGNWFPWLKKELEKKGIKVEAPEMPNTNAPEIERWVNHLAKYVDDNADNYLIGHSIGCQTILRYLEKKPENIKIKGVLLVAGWLTLVRITSPPEKEIARPWLETPIDFKKIKGKFISIFSDDDPYVPENNWKKFEELGDTIVLHCKGHIDSPEPEILKSALKLIG